jgi:hypothetical protein
MVIRLDKNEFNPPVDFQLICICSSLKEYQMAMLLNTGLRFELWRQPDVNAEAQEGQMPLYARFRWDDHLACREVILLGNSPLVRQELAREGDLFGSETVTLLLAELPKVDYLLQFIGNFEPEELEDLREELHAMPGIDLAYVCDPTSLKNITPLLS